MKSFQFLTPTGSTITEFQGNTLVIKDQMVFVHGDQNEITAVAHLAPGNCVKVKVK